MAKKASALLAKLEADIAALVAIKDYVLAHSELPGTTASVDAPKRTRKKRGMPAAEKEAQS